MSPQSLYVLILVLTFILGLILGSGLTLWMFAKDKTIRRVTEDDIVIPMSEFEKIKKKLSLRQVDED